MSRTFGDYELLSEIERGGMGIVYRARERYSGRLVALKMMLSESAHGPADLQRFILEARATGELQHPGIVAIHAWGEHDGHPFYTMDYVPGVPLNRILEKGRLPPEKAVRYLTGIARAVAAAHALGIVHRDLKPSNVIIDPSDQPRVLDFGLAKRQRQKPAPAGSAAEVLEVLPVGAATPAGAAQARQAGPLTEKGAIIGTPSYMAPEQVRAEHDRIGPPTDVHALGALFYEMLTGRPPFQADSTLETLVQVRERQAPPLRQRNPRLPATLEAVCARCLEKAAEHRYPDAGALADDLDRRWHRTVQSRRFAQLTLVAAAVLLFLQLVQVLLGSEVEALGQRARDLAPASGPVRDTAALLARLAQVIVFLATPILAGLGALAWLGAWIWHADRAWPFVVVCTVAAVLGLGAWAVLPAGVGVPFFLPWLLVASAATAAFVPVYHWWTATEASEAEARHPRSEPYLQRLFAVRVEAAPRTAARPQEKAVELADFELSKTLYSGEECEVRRGRQKSLDRPVLVWLDRQAIPAGAAVPGVVVRHPAVLNLHAVGSSTEGRFLVTEPLAATPLPELQEQRPLMPIEAVTLAARLAQALQAFHDQGACHGRLRAAWVLVHGDLEPALCPCGVPSQSATDRVRDVAALGQLLHSWLPARPRGWQRHFLAPVYRVCDAAQEGAYDRAGNLADDLDRAIQAVQVRWRERWFHSLLLGVFALFLVALGISWGLDRFSNPGPTQPAGGASPFAGPLLLVLCPLAMLLGYSHGRSFIRCRQFQRRDGRRDQLVMGSAWLDLIQAALLLIAVAGLVLSGLLGTTRDMSVALTLLWLYGAMAGFWLLGACIAGLVLFAELLVRSVRNPI
jgi:serine/threonine protein kinase